MRIAERFVVRTRVAAGSMGEVWLGEDEHLGSRVAVKLLREEFRSDSWAVERFLAEARIAARLETRHVVRVLDYGTTGCGRPFVVMEYLDGETLAARLERTKTLPPADMLRILSPIARTLARAHAFGVVHRDVKPSNIFLAVDEDGGCTPKLLDFGVAKILGSTPFASPSTPSMPAQAVVPDLEDTLPRLSIAPARRSRALAETDDRVLGTPPYMAPEQCASIPDAAPASDQWAFGVVVYECLTGFLPFPLVKRADMYRVLQFGRYTPARRVNPELPAAFDRWLRTVLSIEPSNRYPNLVTCVEALAAAFEGFEAEPPSLPRPPRPPGRTHSGSRSAMVAAGLSFCVAAVLGARSAEPQRLAPSPPLDDSHIRSAPPPPRVAPSCPSADSPHDVLPASRIGAGSASAHLSSASHAGDLSASYRADPY
ncbi:MAG TPA: serine/threonine-protein kinase [Polyangiaceae bacterium]